MGLTLPGEVAIPERGDEAEKGVDGRHFQQKEIKAGWWPEGVWQIWRECQCGRSGQVTRRAEGRKGDWSKIVNGLYPARIVESLVGLGRGLALKHLLFRKSAQDKQAGVTTGTFPRASSVCQDQACAAGVWHPLSISQLPT